MLSRPNLFLPELTRAYQPCLAFVGTKVVFLHSTPFLFSEAAPLNVFQVLVFSSGPGHFLFPLLPAHLRTLHPLNSSCCSLLRCHFLSKVFLTPCPGQGGCPLPFHSLFITVLSCLGASGGQRGIDFDHRCSSASSSSDREQALHTCLLNKLSEQKHRRV